MKLTGFRRAREARGWTQEDLANKIGVHPITVTRWEVGTRKPDIDTLRRLSELFSITVDDLLATDDAQAGGAA